MVVEPKKGRVVAVKSMNTPENNEQTKETLERALKKHNKVDCFVYDRNCSFKPSMQNLKVFKKIKYWSIDKWHGKKHKKSCKCNPEHIARLKRRLKDVNTNICEQVFAWFRGYARTANEMRVQRNKFLVLYYIKLHNENVAMGSTDYLNEHKHKFDFKRKAKPYACSTKRIMKKKSMKRAKSMKLVKKSMKH